MEIFGHRMYSKVDFHHDRTSEPLGKSGSERDFEILEIPGRCIRHRPYLATRMGLPASDYNNLANYVFSAVGNILGFQRNSQRSSPLFP